MPDNCNKCGGGGCLSLGQGLVRSEFLRFGSSVTSHRVGIFQLTHRHGQERIAQYGDLCLLKFEHSTGFTLKASKMDLMIHFLFFQVLYLDGTVLETGKKIMLRPTSLEFSIASLEYNYF